MMAAEDLQQLRELVEFLKANGIAEFDMERTDLKEIGRASCRERV